MDEGNHLIVAYSFGLGFLVEEAELEKCCVSIAVISCGNRKVIRVVVVQIHVRLIIRSEIRRARLSNGLPS